MFVMTEIVSCIWQNPVSTFATMPSMSFYIDGFGEFVITTGTTWHTVT